MGWIADIVKKGWLKGGKLELTKEEFDRAINMIQHNGYVTRTCTGGRVWKLTIKEESKRKTEFTVWDLDIELIQ